MKNPASLAVKWYVTIRGNLDNLAFVTLGHRVGLAPVVEVCGSLLREIEGQHVRCHFEHVRTPKRA